MALKEQLVISDYFKSDYSLVIIMPAYEVYQHPKTRKYRAVKQGTCWPAIIFGPLWAFSRRLYLFGFALSSVWFLLLLLSVMTESLSFPFNKSANIVYVIFIYALAIYANGIYRWFLKFKGFEYKGVVNASWPSKAIPIVMNKH